MFLQLIGPGTTTFFINIVGGIVVTGNSFLFWTFAILGLVFSVCFQKFFQSLIALQLGDEMQKYSDRLTLNPAKHLDVIGIIILLFSTFIYGKPVNFNPNSFKSPSQGTLLTALSGPGANVLLAATFGILFIILKQIPFTSGNFNSASSALKGLLSTFTYSLPYIGGLNIGLAILNLLPLYPLDGINIWGYIHYKVDDFIRRYVTPYGIWIMIILILPLFNGKSILNFITQPVINEYIQLVS